MLIEWKKPALSLSLLSMSFSTYAAVSFVEKDGIVVMEAESVPLDGDWKLKTGLAGYTGTGYIEAANSGTLSYDITFVNTGTYHLQWRSAAPHNTEHNDSFARMTGPSVEMKSNGGAPCLTSGWLKVFNNAGGDKWSWQTKNCDHTSNQITFIVKQAGQYKFEIKRRSDLHKIDRIVLNDESKVGNSAAQSLSLAPTLADGSSTPPTPSADPTVMVEPAQGAGLTMGGTVTLKGEGQNLSWSYDADSDGKASIDIGNGAEVSFLVPTGITGPKTLTLTLSGSNGNVVRTFDLAEESTSSIRIGTAARIPGAPEEAYDLNGRSQPLSPFSRRARH